MPNNIMFHLICLSISRHPYYKDIPMLTPTVHGDHIDLDLDTTSSTESDKIQELALHHIDVHLPNRDEYSFSMLNLQDPGFLVVSASQPTRALTIFNADNRTNAIMPINLGVATELNLRYQIFKGFFHKKDMGAWFTWEAIKNKHPEIVEQCAYVIASGLELHATRSLHSTDQNFFMEGIKNSRFFRIMSSGKCLTVHGEIHKQRNAYPLVFMKCDGSKEQMFTFVSVMKAVCNMGIGRLCGRKEKANIHSAENVVMKKMKTLMSNNKYRG